MFDRAIGHMAKDEFNFENEVSEFLEKSCPERQTWRSGLSEYLRENYDWTYHAVRAEKCRQFQVHTGSGAEFFIDPMLTCIGDIDVMFHYSNELAVPYGHPPPKQLSADFERCVRVYEIVGSHLPGYVYLSLSYVLSKNSLDGKYVVEYVKQENTHLNHEKYITAGFLKPHEIHGPARKFRLEVPKFFSIHIDRVPCIRCLEWPPQAADWPTRHRNYGWPTTATIDAVVSNGHDVVAVAHPTCKDDEWMRKHQWRLSFSRAEVILLRSWTTEQQIVYHMLRTFVKTERLTNNLNNHGSDTFSNYHIKTLMLWACETKPQNWWTESNLVTVCVKVMHCLDEWLRKSHGQHYFISDVHFCDYFDTTDIHTVCATMMSVTVSNLTQWFVDSYMHKCLELCPQNICLLCSDVITREVLHETVTTILGWKDHIASKTATADTVSILASLLFGHGEGMFRQLISFVQKFENNIKFNPTSIFSTVLNSTYDSLGKDMYRQLFTLKSSMPLEKLISFVQKLENNIKFNPTSIFSTVLNLTYGEKDMFVDLFLPIATIATKFVAHDDGHAAYVESCPISLYSTNLPNAVSAFTTAIKLIKFATKTQHNDEDIELAKMWLMKVLKRKDFDSDSIYCTANVYLAVLYCITRQYQRAIDHCTLVTRSQDHSQCSLYLVQGMHLPKIDDNIDNALGLAVFYQYLKTATLTACRIFTADTGVFTPELLAHYLVAKRVLLPKCRLAAALMVNPTTQTMSEQLTTYRSRLLDYACKDIVTSDLLLCKLPNNIHMDQHTVRKNASPPTSAEVIQLLQQDSIENAINWMDFRRLPVLERSVTMSSITGFLPLYLYRLFLQYFDTVGWVF